MHTFVDGEILTAQALNDLTKQLSVQEIPVQLLSEVSGSLTAFKLGRVVVLFGAIVLKNTLSSSNVLKVSTSLPSSSGTACLATAFKSIDRKISLNPFISRQNFWFCADYGDVPAGTSIDICHTYVAEE